MAATSFSLKSRISVATQSFPRGFAWCTSRQVRHGSTHSRLAQFLRSARGMRQRAGGGASSDRVGRTWSESQSSCRHKTPPCQSRSTSERSQCGTSKGARHAASLFRRMVGRPRRDRGRERQAARVEARDLRQLRDAAAGRGRDRIDPLTRRAHAPSLETIERGSRNSGNQRSVVLTFLRRGSSPSRESRTCRRTCQSPWPRMSWRKAW